ncbi:MAG: hypothetical protein AB9919_12595 [Geobacteraceae bacterium]
MKRGYFGSEGEELFVREEREKWDDYPEDMMSPPPPVDTPYKVGASEKTSEMLSKLDRFMTTVLICVAVSAGMIAGYDRWFAQKIVALDVKGYIAEQRDLFISGKIDEEQLKRNFDRLEKVKEKVPGNRVIILGDVLVRKNVEVIEP